MEKVDLIGVEPEEKRRSCSICRKRAQSHIVRIRDDRGINIIGLTVCRDCMRSLAVSVCAAYFNFDSDKTL